MAGSPRGDGAARGLGHAAAGLALAMLLSAACARSPRASEPAPSAPDGYSDPFAYCRRVGTIDVPDARYVGEAVPDSIARALSRKQLRDTHGDERATLYYWKRTSVWRCAEGRVMGCIIGANIPCREKADVGATPSPSMVEHCRTVTDGVIPAVVSGRASIFTWTCSAGVPVIVRQWTEPDAQGFLSAHWHEIHD